MPLKKRTERREGPERRLKNRRAGKEVKINSRAFGKIFFGLDENAAGSLKKQGRTPLGKHSTFHTGHPSKNLVFPDLRAKEHRAGQRRKKLK
ncbi:MAG: hypothetical protein QT03_C0001G1064 [archaeon GW2011_AR10]|nr:MAG: hypothetical protein QT03_C0001G1064 [archaeon GW2011_AR10]KKR36712.1 MAG: hypothetical protein UT71_C0032G0008 [Parcubacteria group bacterium GW2011_GWF2_40_10]